MVSENALMGSKIPFIHATQQLFTELGVVLGTVDSAVGERVDNTSALRKPAF